MKDKVDDNLSPSIAIMVLSGELDLMIESGSFMDGFYSSLTNIPGGTFVLSDPRVASMSATEF